MLTVRRIGEIERRVPAVLQVDLTVQIVRPGRCVGVFEIRHEHLGAAVQRVDDHLAVHRSGDLDPPVEQVHRNRRDPPVAIADRLRLGEEIRQFAGIQPRLPLRTCRDQRPPPRIERPVQSSQKGEGVAGENLVVPWAQRPFDLNAGNG